MSHSADSESVDRRTFLAQTTLAALGALIAASCGGSTDSLTGTGPVNVTITLADYPALASVGGIARLSGTTTPIAVVRTSSGYRAFSLICPHQGSTVGINGSGFRCPNHGATFASSGAWTGGQPTSGLRAFNVAENTSAGTLTITS